MEIDLPVRGLEPLAPLVAWLVVYLALLILLRLFLWPLLRALLARGTLRLLLRRLILNGFRLALVGGLLLAALGALSILMWGVSPLDWLAGTPEVEFGLSAGALAIGGLLIVLLLFLYRRVLRAISGRVRPRR